MDQNFQQPSQQSTHPVTPGSSSPQNGFRLSKKHLLFGAIILAILIALSIIVALLSKSSEVGSTPTSQTTQSGEVAPLTQDELDEWSKKLVSGSAENIRSVMVVSQDQPLDSDGVEKLASIGPFKFDLSTFRENTSKNASIEVEVGSPPKPGIASLVVVNGKWKIADMQPAKD